METKGFENVKPQIARCGLWCGSCIVGNGVLRELTRRYAHLIDGYGIDKWGATDFDGKEFMKGLKSVQNLPICKGCLKGGGNETCKVRPCVQSKRIPTCNECTEQTSCDNLEALRKVREGALAVGMIVKSNKVTAEPKQLIKKWTGKVKGEFPYCVIDVK